MCLVQIRGYCFYCYFIDDIRLFVSTKWGIEFSGIIYSEKTIIASFIEVYDTGSPLNFGQLRVLFFIAIETAYLVKIFGLILML